MTSQSAKAQLREHIRATRRNRPPAQRESLARQLAQQVMTIPDIADMHRVCAYVSTSTEPGTQYIREFLTRRGIQVLLPVVTTDYQLRWVIDDAAAEGSADDDSVSDNSVSDNSVSNGSLADAGTAGAGDAMAADQEAAGTARNDGHTMTDSMPAESIATAQLILVPALAADAYGTRLGQGGGYYDRALAQRGPASLVVAVIFDEEWYPADTSLPREAHDHVAHAVLTPSRYLPLQHIARP